MERKEKDRRCAVCGFKYFSPQGASTVSIRLRGSGRGQIVVSDGSATLATVPVSPAEEWTAFSAPFKTPGQVFALYFLFLGDGAIDILDFTLA